MQRTSILCDLALYSRLVYVTSMRNPQYFGISLQRFLMCVPRVCQTRSLSIFPRLPSRATSYDSSESATRRLDDQFTKALRQGDTQKAMELFKFAKTHGNAPPKMYSEVMHLLCLDNEHEMLDDLYREICSHGFRIGEGVRMTLIKSYVSRKMWNEALDLLDDMKDENLMRHTRTFNPVIKGLAEAGHPHKAFELFDKKLRMSHRIISGHENIISDKEMFVSMIKSCMIDSSQTSIGKSASRSSVPTNIRTAHTNTHSLVFQLFEVFYQYGLKFSPDIIQVCKEWSTLDESHLWKWSVCSIGKTGKCNLCQSNLHEDLTNDYFKDLENELIDLISGESNKLKLIHEEKEELKYVSDLCRRKGPFDVIIDAQNIGLEGKRKGTSSSFPGDVYEKRLISVVEYFSKQKKNIFLPLHDKAMKNDISEKLLIFLRSHCHVQVLKTPINEDLLLLYAAALSGMDCYKTCIVSNDNWRDHSSVLSFDSHWKLLKWARINHISFTLTHKNKLKFHKNYVDPVLHRSDHSWHFPMIDSRWQCARLQRK